MATCSLTLVQQMMTRYKGLKSNSTLASWFWEAMKDLSPVELSLFLRFVS